jgi:hypothetical protein
MRQFMLSAHLLAAVSAVSLATPSTAAWFERHACGMPARASCGGCAVSCPAGAIAVCRAGMSIWRGTRWLCSFQPVCTCQRTLWQIQP